MVDHVLLPVLGLELAAWKNIGGLTIILLHLGVFSVEWFVFSLIPFTRAGGGCEIGKLIGYLSGEWNK